MGRCNSKMIGEIILMDIVLYLENPGFNWRVLELVQ